MYIKNTNQATKSLYTEELVDDENEPLLDEPVEFADNGTAQVTQQVGEALVERYDAIEPKDTDT
ncbi:hypothetical protein DJ84_18405 [Halorubrum ezzemoulense]|nr:hypothetical protein DJ84_18405 [Halorubrum ezzemoulense]